VTLLIIYTTQTEGLSLTPTSDPTSRSPSRC